MDNSFDDPNRESQINVSKRDNSFTETPLVENVETIDEPLLNLEDKMSMLSTNQIEELTNRKQSSDFQSFVNSCKLCFGNAYLSIPNVFSLTGWLGGIFLMSFVGALNIYTMR
jgi:hypothetical protein